MVQNDRGSNQPIEDSRDVIANRRIEAADRADSKAVPFAATR